jgi:transposase
MRRIGIDIALKAAHKAAVFDGGERKGKPFSVAPTRAGLDELVRRATSGTDEPCEFVMEPTGLGWLPVAAELVRQGHRTYLPKPQKTSALRKFLAAHTKTDANDACAAALVRHVDPDNTHELHVPTADETTLKLCVKQRARLVVEAAKAKGRIHAWLVLANPHLGKALGRDASSDVATAFLRRHLDPFEVIARGKGELARFWQAHSSGRFNAAQLESVWAACETTCELYAALRAGSQLPFEYASIQLLVRQALEQIEFGEGQVAELDALIAARYVTLDPTRLLEQQVPGVGAVIAAAVEAFAGDPTRFSSVKCYAAFYGLVPRTKQTGGADGKPRQRLTKGGHNLLKQYMFLAAETARRADPELAAVYEKAIARGKHHYSAVIIVAHKLVRRIYAVLRQRTEARAGAAVEPRYRLQQPDGTALTTQQARAWVAEQFPSKRAKQARNKRTAGDARQTRSVPQEGSSEDVTRPSRLPPPVHFVPETPDAVKLVGESASNVTPEQAPFSLASS